MVRSPLPSDHRRSGLIEKELTNMHALAVASIIAVVFAYFKRNPAEVEHLASIKSNCQRSEFRALAGQRGEFSAGGLAVPPATLLKAFR